MKRELVERLNEFLGDKNLDEAIRLQYSIVNTMVIDCMKDEEFYGKSVRVLFANRNDSSGEVTFSLKDTHTNETVGSIVVKTKL